MSANRSATGVVSSHMTRSPARARSPEALEAVLHHGDEASRAQAAWALGLSEHAGGRAALLAALADPSARVREQAVWALGVRRDRDARLALVLSLSDEAAPVRSRAAWALGLVGNAAAVAPLVDSLGDADADVREQAAWALGQLGDPRATHRLIDIASSDSEGRVREAAQLALAGLDLDPDAAPLPIGDCVSDVIADALRVLHGRPDAFHDR